MLIKLREYHDMTHPLNESRVRKNNPWFGRSYLRRNRLADVLALIQALALHPTQTHRRDENLFEDLGGPPASCESWYQLASYHPEFFRISWPKWRYVPVPGIPALSEEDIEELDSPVADNNKWPISLLVRHLSPRKHRVEGDKDLRIAPLPIETIQPLMKLAIDLHDQQEKQLTKWVAVVGTLLAAAIAAITALALTAKNGTTAVQECCSRATASTAIPAASASASLSLPNKGATK